MMERMPATGRFWTAAAALICALLLFATACGPSGGGDQSNCIFGVASGGECVNSEQCFFPSDCLPGFTCTQGTCTPDQECTSDAECDAGVCNSDGVCANPDTCSSNDDCVSKTYCDESGTCAPDPCENVTCVRGTCIPGSGQCVSASICTRDTELFDCIQGERCLDEQCRPADEYCSQLSCARGVCSFTEGGCVAADNCAGDNTRCLEGQFCDENNQCQRNLCDVNDVECEEGVCVGSTGECENAESCTSTEECLADHWCVEGTCQLQSMACGEGDGDGGCFGNQACVYDDSSMTTSCEAPDVCTTSLDCLDGTQCGGVSCLTTVPCAEDRFEPNGNASQATPFTDVDNNQRIDASLCASDTDVYWLNIGDLEPSAVRGLLSVELRYQERDIGLGEIQVDLLEEQGDGSYTSVATGTAGARGQDGRIELTHEVGPTTVGGFRIEVSGVDSISGAGISYNLGVDIIDDLVVDACENAELIADGEILTSDLRQATSSLLRHTCSRGQATSERSEQVFVFDVAQASRATVTITPEVSTDDPVVSIRESCTTVGTEVACSDASTENESIDGMLLDPGTYYIVVSASPSGSLNRYDVALTLTEATCSASSSYCEGANTAQICVGGTGLTGVDCASGCNPTSGRCFPVDGNICGTATAPITGDLSETVEWGELTNNYEAGAAGCVPTADGSTQTGGPDKAFQVTIPDLQGIRATLDVGNSDKAALHLVRDCADLSGSCLTGVNANATGDETLIWANRTGSEVTAYLIADSSEEALLSESQLTIEFVDLVCDPQGSNAQICDPNNPGQVLDCGENGTEYVQGEDCGGFPCESGACLRPDTCSTAIDITADAQQSGGMSLTAPYADFTGDYSGSGCGVSNSGSGGADAVFELTLQDGEALDATTTVNGSYWSSMYLMPTCAAVDSTCLAGDGADGTDSALSYMNNTGAAQTMFLFVDNDDVGSGDFTLQAEIINPVCGNNTVEPGEACDDGNTSNGDGCSDVCQIETICGSGRLEGTEECEDGNAVAGDGCSDTCMLEANPLTLSGTSGATTLLAGSLESSDPTFARVGGSCTVSSFADNAYYDTYEFTNNTGAAVTIDVTATWTFDGYINIFDSTFDPTAPESSCLDADDDFNGTGQSQVTGLTVADGETIIIVATSYSNGSTGDYTMDVVTQ